MPVETISAVTLAVRDMARSVEFYQDQVGLEFLYGGREASFTSFRVGGPSDCRQGRTGIQQHGAL